MNLTLSYSGLGVFILSVPPSAFLNLGGMSEALAIEDWGIEVIENLSLLFILFIIGWWSTFLNIFHLVLYIVYVSFNFILFYIIIPVYTEKKSVIVDIYWCSLDV